MRTTGWRFDMKLISQTGLVDYMKHRELSQAELARRAGVSPQLINHLCRGARTTCLPTTARKIEAALDAPKGFIFLERVSTVTRDTTRPLRRAA